MWCAPGTRCVWAGPALSELVRADKVAREVFRRETIQVHARMVWQHEGKEAGERCVCLHERERKRAIDACNERKWVLHPPIITKHRHALLCCHQGAGGRHRSFTNMHTNIDAHADRHTCGYSTCATKSFTLFFFRVLHSNQHSSVPAEAGEWMRPPPPRHLGGRREERLRRVMKIESKWEMEEEKQN